MPNVDDLIKHSQAKSLIFSIVEANIFSHSSYARLMLIVVTSKTHSNPV